MPEGTPHRQGTDDLDPPPRHDLVDDALLAEIELLVDVMTAVAGHAGYLSTDEVDSILGLPSGAHGAFRGPQDIDAFAVRGVDLTRAGAGGGRCL